ncbi:hypothetical protein L2E82_30782 [Cichorium intybus]|uniref:Uncharacterized protein n=1 Tax=Cichorium intybus TaxID=13427 RepID=A0ACB9D1B9_CICIN|nr:hypothetical protein L2E82_30782 [Cichorium intybus]
MPWTDYGRKREKEKKREAGIDGYVLLAGFHEIIGTATRRGNQEEDGQAELWRQYGCDGVASRSFKTSFVMVLVPNEVDDSETQA